ncbi:MAG: type II toxin-antitoxin system RelE/ParE family toxin [Deltaproteobacteria bacterium]|nr:type II toxin-antitoxin system RelE/ParE family toxin [Deltaproteobacteria bacterium]
MAFKISYHPDVSRIDIKSIDKKMQRRIKTAIEMRLAADPWRFGAPLHRSLKGFRKLRVGDYRVIYDVAGEEVRIYVVGNRKEVYGSAMREWH